MEKLKKFKGKLDFKKKALIGVYAILIIGIILMGTTYAVYQTSDEVTFINARVGKFVANDIELAMTLDGKEVESPPEKNSLYTVTVNCDNATGRWDMNEWAAVVGSISSNKVKCQVDFSTPEPTLSEVTATSDKTTISLSYTAGGIGTNTTCVYGTDTNYGNTVEGTTNSNCNITGLEMDTTYYYKVCAKNGAGEVCKDGSIKTKPNSTPFTSSDVGKYVSMTPTSTSYTIPGSLTGYSSDQTINPSELNLWRVIKVNSDGTIEMVSDEVSSKNVRFSGKNGYINLVSGLNTIAAQYTDGKHVLRTRHIGYSDQTQTITDTGALSSTSAPWKMSNMGSLKWESCDSTSYLCGKNDALGGGDVGYLVDFYPVAYVYKTMGANKVGTQIRTAYWLSSRGYSYLSYSRWEFRGHRVTADGSLNYIELYKYNSGFVDGSGAYAIRPVVTLKSTSEHMSGSGTSSSPYILN